MKLNCFLFMICLFMTFSAVANTPCTGPSCNVDVVLVKGVVLDKESRKPLKDVNVTAISQSKTEKIVSTDNNGAFHFIMLKPDTYRLVFEKEGYKKVIKDKVEVKEKIPVRINVELFEFIPISDREPSIWHFFES